MDVRCDKCETTYEFDDSRLTESGVHVKCSRCGHLFQVRRRPPFVTREIPGLRGLSAQLGSDGKESGPGRVVLPKERGFYLRLKQTQEVLRFRDLTTLRQWILEKRVVRDDDISRGGRSWRRLGQVVELESFFHSAGQAERARLRTGKTGPASAMSSPASVMSSMSSQGAPLSHEPRRLRTGTPGLGVGPAAPPLRPGSLRTAEDGAPRQPLRLSSTGRTMRPRLQKDSTLPGFSSASASPVSVQSAASQPVPASPEAPTPRMSGAEETPPFIDVTKASRSPIQPAEAAPMQISDRPSGAIPQRIHALAGPDRLQRVDTAAHRPIPERSPAVPVPPPHEAQPPQAPPRPEPQRPQAPPRPEPQQPQAPPRPESQRPQAQPHDLRRQAPPPQEALPNRPLPAPPPLPKEVALPGVALQARRSEIAESVLRADPVPRMPHAGPRQVPVHAPPGVSAGDDVDSAQRRGALLPRPSGAEGPAPFTDSAQRSEAPFTDSAQRSEAPFTDSAQRSEAPFTDDLERRFLAGPRGGEAPFVDERRDAELDTDAYAPPHPGSLLRRGRLAAAAALVGLLAFAAVYHLTQRPGGSAQLHAPRPGAAAYAEGRQHFLRDTDDDFQLAHDLYLRAAGADDANPAPIAALAELHATWAHHLRDDARAAPADAPRLSQDVERHARIARTYADQAARLDPAAAAANRAQALLLLDGDAPRDQVEAYLHKAAQGDDPDGEVPYLQALLALREHNEDEARGLLERSLAESAREHGALLRAAQLLGELEGRAGHVESAQRLFGVVLKGSPDHQRAQRALAGVTASPADAGAQPPAAEPPTVKPPPAEVAEDDEPPLRDRLAQAQRLLENGRVRDAQRIYQKLLDPHGDSPEVHAGLGACAIETEHYQAAVDHYREALRRRADFPPAMIGLAEAYKLRGDRQKALDGYRSYLKKNPAGDQAQMARNNIERLRAAAERPSPPAPEQPADSPPDLGPEPVAPTPF